MLGPETRVVLSALAFSVSALIICLLVLRYGFMGDSELLKGERGHAPSPRGHALAAALFGAGVIFAVLALTALPLGGMEGYRHFRNTLVHGVDRARARLAAIDTVFAVEVTDPEQSRESPAKPTLVAFGDVPVASVPSATAIYGPFRAYGPPPMAELAGSPTRHRAPESVGGKPVKASSGRLARWDDTTGPRRSENAERRANLLEARERAERFDVLASVERAERPDKLEIPSKLDKPEKLEKLGKLEKPEKLDKPEKLEKLDKLEKVDRLEKPEKLEKVEKIEKVDRIDKIERIEKVARVERPERIEKLDRPEKLERIAKPERLERPERRGR